VIFKYWLTVTTTESAEVFPVDLKLDYKPRRVDYRALREGRTIELMNFFHFDGAEMTLRHITLAGVSVENSTFQILSHVRRRSQDGHVSSSC
jgi:autophagy-related protein 2